jgi:heat shock protein HslJ
MKKISYLLFLSLLFNCAEKNYSDIHEAKTSLDYQGTYVGTLPCADCEGIAYKLILAEDTFSLETTYLGKSQEVISSTGTYSWTKQKNVIQLSNKDYYWVIENQLVKLDMQGNKISGALADKYYLKKEMPIQSPIIGKWKITEMMGQPIKTEGAKTPMLEFRSDGRFSGNAGCNNIGGGFELKEPLGIRFSKIMSTLMACADMQQEEQLKQALETADNFSLSENQLTLNKGRMAPLVTLIRMP